LHHLGLEGRCVVFSHGLYSILFRAFSVSSFRGPLYWPCTVPNPLRRFCLGYRRLSMAVVAGNMVVFWRMEGRGGGVSQGRAALAAPSSPAAVTARCACGQDATDKPEPQQAG